MRHHPEKAKGGRRGADMSTLTLEPTCGEDVDRSVAAGAAARREAAGPQVGRAVDPEVAAVARRRKFSDQYKLRILAEIEANSGSVRSSSIDCSLLNQPRLKLLSTSLLSAQNRSGIDRVVWCCCCPMVMRARDLNIPLVTLNAIYNYVLKTTFRYAMPRHQHSFFIY